MSKLRLILRRHPTCSRTQHVCDIVVAYFVPGPVWRAWARFPYWHRWYWRNG